MTSGIRHLGGLSSKAQEDALRGRPDILVATPGRLIDHLQTTSSFSLQALTCSFSTKQIACAEIIRSCPSSGGEVWSGRQTMLFSATISDEVDKLVQLSMHRPIPLEEFGERTQARICTGEM